MGFLCGFETHRAGSGVGDLPRVGHPLVIGTLLVGEGSVEDHADVGHGVDAHRRAFKHRPGGGREIKGERTETTAAAAAAAAARGYRLTHSLR